MVLESPFERFRQRYYAVFSIFTIMTGDGALPKIEVFDAQAEAQK